MKITLKISLPQLNALALIFNALSNEPINSRTVKVARSVLDNLGTRIKKKQIDEMGKSTLFSAKKKISLVLEYHEGHYLEKFILLTDHYPMSDCYRTDLRVLNGDLNQKLT